MCRYLLIGSAFLFAAAPASAQKIEPLDKTTPALPQQLPWWGTKPKNNQQQWSDLKGKVVLVHFWTVENSTAEANLHYFVNWKDDNRKSGFEILGFHVQPSDTEWEEAKIVKRAKELIPYMTSILDQPGDSLHDWNVEKTPALFLIDRKGKIRYRFDGVMTWKKNDVSGDVKAKLLELLAEKP
jgi:glutathione peroxidase-family protein